MFSGIGIVVVIVGIISQRRIQSLESRLDLMTQSRPRLFDDETKRYNRLESGGLDGLTEDEFDTLIARVKTMSRPFLEESKNWSKCSSVTTFIMRSLNFA